MNTLDERQAFIERLKKAIIALYDVSDIQIFVFGSFLTDDFKPGVSDIEYGFVDKGLEVSAYA